MSRTIRFRAWHLDEKLLCPVQILTDKGAFLVGVKNGEDTIDGRTTFVAPKNGRFCESAEIKLMQYTGLMDKNGKEIFEGDILAWDNDQIDFPSGDGERMKVEWHGELSRFGLSFYSNHGGEGYTGTVQNIHEYVKRGAYIIGNIHENPELI